MNRPQSRQEPLFEGSLAAKTHRTLSIYGVLLPLQVRELINHLAQTVDALSIDVQKLKETRK